MRSCHERDVRSSYALSGEVNTPSKRLCKYIQNVRKTLQVVIHHQKDVTSSHTPSEDVTSSYPPSEDVTSSYIPQATLQVVTHLQETLQIVTYGRKDVVRSCHERDVGTE